MTNQQKEQGRPKMTPLERAKSRAARDYRSYLHTFTEEFEGEVERKRVQFVNSRKRMGRPPLSLKNHQDKAKRHWEASWAQYVDQCESAGIEPESRAELESYRAKDKSGRRGHDRILYLLKYVRQQQRKAERAEQVPEEEYQKALEQTRGRPPMSKAEKVQHFQRKAEEARREALEKITSLQRSEQFYYEIYELKVDRRQIRMCINHPSSPQAQALGLSAEQAKERVRELDNKISDLEIERDQAIKKEKLSYKKMSLHEVSEKAWEIFQDAAENASDHAKKAGDEELEDLQRRVANYEAILKEERLRQWRKRAEEKEKELRELGIDPRKIANS